MFAGIWYVSNVFNVLVRTCSALCSGLIDCIVFEILMVNVKWKDLILVDSHLKILVSSQELDVYHKLVKIVTR